MQDRDGEALVEGAASRNEQGLVAPDGRTAALVAVTDDGSPAVLRLLDLDTGTERIIPLEIQLAGYGLDSVVWSPDSRWLFAVGAASGQLVAVDAAAARPTPLGVELPPLTQLAIRPALPSR